MENKITFLTLESYYQYFKSLFSGKPNAVVTGNNPSQAPFVILRDSTGKQILVPMSALSWFQLPSDDVNSPTGKLYV